MIGTSIGRMVQGFFCGLALLMLAACGGAGGATSTTPTTATSASLSGLGVSYNAASDTITLADRGSTETLARTPTEDRYFPGFQVYRSSSGDAFAVRGESPSGDLIASGGVANVGGPGRVSTGASVIRRSDGTIPTSGSARFTGTYAGALTTEGVSFLAGDAQLAVDFGTGTVSGKISHRTFVEGGSLDDLVLSSGTIGADGSFSGKATGGAATGIGGSDTTLGGSFQGLFGGGNGSEAAGLVQITHNLAGSSGAHVAAAESGAFIASQ